MEKYAMEPIKVVGWEGVFGFLVTLVGMIILHFSIGTGYFNAREGFYQMTHYRAIAVSSLLIMISIGYVFPNSFFRDFTNSSTAASTSSVSQLHAPCLLPRAPPSTPAVHSSSGSCRWVWAGRHSSGSRFWVSHSWYTERSCLMILSARRLRRVWRGRMSPSCLRALLSIFRG